jgi:hypothetical protein
MKRITFPNILAIAAALAIAVSLLYPWWSLEIEIIGKTYIYPYIIKGPATEVLGYRRTAQMPLLTGALIGCIALALIGSVLGKRAGRIALVVAGLLSAGAAWRFYVRALDIASRYHMTSVNGKTVARMMSFSPLHVAASLQPGFYVNLAGAGLCLLAALFHSKLHPSRVKESGSKS